MTPRLVAITDLSRASRSETLDRLERLSSAASPGTVLVQLRDLGLSARERLAFGRELLAVCRNTGQYLAVNDRLDLVEVLDADAVHLGEASVTTPDARRLLGARFLTRACHDPSRVAELDADGILLSPILAARKGRSALGVEALKVASAALAAPSPPTPSSSLPTRGGPPPHAATHGAVVSSDAGGTARRPRLYALGGVDARGVAPCLAAGADGVAVIGAWLDDEREGELVDALGIGWHGRGGDGSGLGDG